MGRVSPKRSQMPAVPCREEETACAQVLLQCAQRPRASSVWPELRRKDPFFWGRGWEGGWKKSDSPAVGNVTRKGTETGNCKTCPASALVRPEGRLRPAMQEGLGQNSVLQGALEDLALSPESAFGDPPLKALKRKKKWEHPSWGVKPCSCNSSVCSKTENGSWQWLRKMGVCLYLDFLCQKCVTVFNGTKSPMNGYVVLMFSSCCFLTLGDRMKSIRDLKF